MKNIKTIITLVLLMTISFSQSEVTFDLDGVDDCGFVSVTGTWDGWSGWGAHTDSGMSASIPDGDHEFVILCVNTEGEWWIDIWGSSIVYNAPGWISGILIVSFSNCKKLFSRYILSSNGIEGNNP